MRRNTASLIFASRPSYGRTFGAVLLAAAVFLTAGCGHRTPEVSSPAAAADRAAREYASDMLQWRAGALPASGVRHIDAEARRQLDQARRPLGSGEPTRLLSATPARVSGQTATVTLTYRNDSEDLTYDQVLTLRRHGGQWFVEGSR